MRLLRAVEATSSPVLAFFEDPEVLCVLISQDFDVARRRSSNSKSPLLHSQVDMCFVRYVP